MQRSARSVGVGRRQKWHKRAESFTVCLTNRVAHNFALNHHHRPGATARWARAFGKTGCDAWRGRRGAALLGGLSLGGSTRFRRRRVASRPPAYSRGTYFLLAIASASRSSTTGGTAANLTVKYRSIQACMHASKQQALKQRGRIGTWHTAWIDGRPILSHSQEANKASSSYALAVLQGCSRVLQSAPPGQGCK